MEMDISEERFNEWLEERMKKELKNLIIEAIQNEYPQNFIDTLIKRGNFTEDEVQEIYKELRHDLHYKKPPIN